MNTDSLFEVLDRCDIVNLLFGLGLTCRLFRNYSKNLLQQKKSLTFASPDWDFTNQYVVFGIGKEIDRVPIFFDKQNPKVFVKNQALNVYNTKAAQKFQQIFPNVTELCFCGEVFKDANNFERFLNYFPNIRSLKCCEMSFDMSKIIAKLPYLRHFTHLNTCYSLEKYFQNVPHIINRLDSFAFSSMDLRFIERTVSRYDFVNFEIIHSEFYELKDSVRQRIANKITSFTKKFNSVEHSEFKKAKYEEFINLEGLAISLCDSNEEGNCIILLKVLKMISNLKKLKIIHLSTFPLSKQRILDCLNNEEFESLRSVKKLYVNCCVNEQNKERIKQIFPSADVFYQRS